ncbi:hypothetical protein LSTR_LSTR003865 [Laodelphax striatellus]|uniref:Protein cereblon n=1 Tax=Laodelphax striatellus TaxID=195883 RepID=A0A482XE02_LAOST|nr:hypothetical protein LSTR_LSTR003865 [Laodelphax striatellus]
MTIYPYMGGRGSPYSWERHIGRVFDDEDDANLAEVRMQRYNIIGLDESDSSDNEENGYDTSSFDKILPSEHTYLGDDMEERRGRTVWEDNSLQAVTLLPPPSIVLVPGQVLPLSVDDQYTIRMLEYCIQERDGVFGVMVKWPVRYGELSDPDYVGTTAEIYEYSKGEVEAGVTRSMTIKAKARQRFKAYELGKTGSGHFYQAKIRILPEVVLKDALYHICPHINRCLSSKSDRFRKRGAITTRWPLWVYDQYHAPKLVERVQKLKYIKQGKDVTLPKNPTALSFWVAQNLPHKQRLMTLKLNSPIQRLRWELSVLERMHTYQCSHCNITVGSKRDVIIMSVDGPQSTYVNPNGYLHETLTLSQTINVKLNGEPSTQFSWFPGYAWITAFCAHCRSHMGWKFVAQKNDLQPKKFWGLSRRSLQMKIVPGEYNEDSVYVM